MNYPLIKKWLTGVQVWSKPLKDEQYVVLASELEDKLAEGFEVYGDESTSFSNCQLGNTHALAIGKQPIKKNTREEAALEFVQKLSEDALVLPNKMILEKAKEILEMK